MRILIASDTHGNIFPLKEAVEKEKPLDLFIHCGDLGVELNKILDFIKCPYHVIAGNNDFFSKLPRQDIFSVGKYSVLLTHGHMYGVYSSFDRLYYTALQNGFNIVMFGHTHVPHIENVGGVWLINPGSISQPRTFDRKYTYIIMEINDSGELSFKLKNL